MLMPNPFQPTTAVTLAGISLYDIIIDKDQFLDIDFQNLTAFLHKKHRFSNQALSIITKR